jgi:hypothetical protein
VADGEPGKKCPFTHANGNGAPERGPRAEIKTTGIAQATPRTVVEVTDERGTISVRWLSDAVKA